MADLSKTVGIIFKASDQASGVTGKLADDIKTIGGVAGGAATKVDELAAETEKLGKSAKSVDLLTDSLRALATGLVVKAFIDANVEMEKFERSMTLLKGSSQAAREEFTYISGVARTLGLNLFDAADAYTSLTAATKGTALEGQATRDIFEAVAKAMSSLGKSGADAQGALLAVSQMVSKGTVSMEELRGQLGERLPGAFQIAANAMGLTTQQLDDLVSSGNLTATEFLPKFAQALKETFGDTSFVDGYAASMARLQNSVSEAFIELGNTGLFELLTKGVEAATASVVGAVAGFKLLGEVAGSVAGAIATANFSELGNAIDTAMAKAADSTRAARDALLGYNQETAKTGEATKGALGDVNQSTAETARLLRQGTTEADKLNTSLKALGIDPAKLKAPLAEIVRSFEELAANPAATGELILAGLNKALKSAETIGDVERLGSALTKAFIAGRISADEFGKASTDLVGKQDKLQAALDRASGATKAQAEELKKNEEAARRAKEAADKYAIEMEKIASNERIKLIEARVTLNVAQIEADTKRVQTMFESINNTIDSTGDVISTALGQVKDLIPNTANFQVITDQLAKENNLRQQSFELQRELTKAQIANMEAQTRQMESGDALIKIDGAGLQPHLEAFMWEILRTIQTRVNRDGLKMLLGV